LAISIPNKNIDSELILNLDEVQTGSKDI